MGRTRDADCDYAGFNGKMTEVCALIGLKLLPTLDRTVGDRDTMASHYIKRLGHLKGIRFQQIQKKSLSFWLYFQFEMIKEECGMSRDELISALEEQMISPSVQFSAQSLALLLQIYENRFASNCGESVLQRNSFTAILRYDDKRSRYDIRRCPSGSLRKEQPIRKSQP